MDTFTFLVLSVYGQDKGSSLSDGSGVIVEIDSNLVSDAFTKATGYCVGSTTPVVNGIAWIVTSPQVKPGVEPDAKAIVVFMHKRLFSGKGIESTYSHDGDGDEGGDDCPF